MIVKIGRTLPALLGVLGILTLSSTALAQGNTFNPYGNSGYADYREFGYPMYSNNPALPGQALLNAKPFITSPRANSYQQYTNELDGSDSSSTLYGRNGSSNLPYYQAYQRLNPKFNRVYRPGDTTADREFFEKQRKRDADYAAALAEKNPAKRAKLLRQIEQESLIRPSTTRPSRPAAGASAANPNRASSTPAASTRAPSPLSSAATTTPALRRRPAPSPFPSTTTRRPSVPGSSTRPPAIDSGAARPDGVTRPAPDPSTIPIPPPR